MKRILGLDLGSNSIGWALVEQDFDKKEGEICGVGSRIIPMPQDQLANFENGVSVSQTAKRTEYRGTRRRYERFKIRRERLHRVLHILGFLPQHYAGAIDFEHHLGQFKNGEEPKINYEKNPAGKYAFLFADSFREMTEDFKDRTDELRKNFSDWTNHHLLKEGAKLPYDWTIYYLRKKALRKRISKEELAWILLHFNQKRGYYYIRGKGYEETDEEKQEKLCRLKVKDVRQTDDRSKNDTWYEVVLENDWIYKRKIKDDKWKEQNKKDLNSWKGAFKEFIATTTKVKRSLKLVDSEKDWIAIKKKVQQDIDASKKRVGEYIYDELLQNPTCKIRGKLIRTIDRVYYEKELKAILQEQRKYHLELDDKELYRRCLDELYPKNKAHRNNLKDKGLSYLLVEDIIFYQRPLKSKKSTISDCQYEFRIFYDKAGEEKKIYLKCIPKSQPLFQEFRLWQFMANLKIYKKIESGGKIDEDVTQNMFPTETDRVHLFDFLNSEKEITQGQILDHLIKSQKIDKGDKARYRWNYIAGEEGKNEEKSKKKNEKKYPANKTRYEFVSRLKKVSDMDQSQVQAFLSPEVENELWHIVYSVTDGQQFEKALKTFAKKQAKTHRVPDIEAFAHSFYENFKTISLEKQYGAYSQKALNRLLPLMRMGKYWDENDENVVSASVKSRFEDALARVRSVETEFLSRLKKVAGLADPQAFLTSEVRLELWNCCHPIGDEKKPERRALQAFARKYRIDADSFVVQFTDFSLDRIVDDAILSPWIKSFLNFKGDKPQGLNTYQACYLVYERHAEVAKVDKWNKPEDIDKYLAEFKQHSLRNPIVEQLVLETLRLVKDIWYAYGKGATDFFDEIHVELGREMKNDAKTRKRISARQAENKRTNERIRKVLQELYKEKVADVRKHSDSQQERLKIYEEGVYANSKDKYKGVELKDINEIRKKSNPKKSEIRKYRLWLEQKYISPYTGATIPLSRLFTADYEIDHIIPKSRYFDDSLSNKVICETTVNKEKDNMTAYEFIEKHGGKEVNLGYGRPVKLLSLEKFESHCKKYFKNNKEKKSKLLSRDVPNSFIERQMNDTRYISKLIKGLLSNIVRADGEREATAKRLIPMVGAITAILRHDWGLEDKWNELIKPRFERLNEMKTAKEKFKKDDPFRYWNENHQKWLPDVPDEIRRKGFSRKRIDHRHHALDALVIACTTRDHVNYINSLNTSRTNHALVSKLRAIEEEIKLDKKTGECKRIRSPKAYHQPWRGFTAAAKKALEYTVVSFKKNNRVLTKVSNYYSRWGKDEKGKWKKNTHVRQEKGDLRAIRKPLHQATFYARVKLVRKEKKKFNAALADWEQIADKGIRKTVRAKALEFNNDLKQLKQYFKKYPIEENGEKVSEVIVYSWAEADVERKSLSEISSWKKLHQITDTGIQKILKNHLNTYQDLEGEALFKAAFSPEGIEKLNRNMKSLNGGKHHQPIYKLRLSKKSGNKRVLGETEGKMTKYVDAGVGSNLFFAVYQDEENGKRTYKTLPFREVVEHQKWRATLSAQERENTLSFPIDHTKGQFLFFLSPNDLVYVPTDEERENPSLFDLKNPTEEQTGRIYKMVSCDGRRCYFVKQEVAISIWDKNEYQTHNKMERDIDGNMIKDRCWKLILNRLGIIEKAVRKL